MHWRQRRISAAASSTNIVRDPADRARLDRLLAADANADEPLSELPFEELAQAIGDIDPAPIWNPGQRIGAFELCEVLGEGGSAMVFQGRA